MIMMTPIGDLDPEITTYEYDDYNKMTGITYPDSSTETLTYDGNGQLTRREKSNGEVTEYQWNTRGFLEKVILPTGEQVEYQYDGANRLIGRTSSEGQDSFVQAGWSIVTEMDALKKRKYYTGLSSKDGADDVVYFHFNHRGDTVLLTDKNGGVVGKFDYEAYGNVVGSDGLNVDEVALKNLPNVFVGAYGIRYDTKTDLSYMRYRWYSPETMRFMSPDRLMGVNRYGYVAGNPIKYIDINGLKIFFPDNNMIEPAYYYYLQFGPQSDVEHILNIDSSNEIHIVVEFVNLPNHHALADTYQEGIFHHLRFNTAYCKQSNRLYLAMIFAHEFRHILRSQLKWTESYSLFEDWEETYAFEAGIITLNNYYNYFHQLNGQNVPLHDIFGLSVYQAEGLQGLHNYLYPSPSMPNLIIDGEYIDIQSRI
jgi:RHS repeat-associated protein